jgi:hypothetical protein
MVDVSKAQLEANLSATRDLLAMAEKEARGVKAILTEIVHRFLAAELDALKVQEQENPTEWPTRELGRWVIEKLDARFTRLEYAAEGDLEKELQEALAEIERLRAENGELKGQADQLAVLEAELARAQEGIKARDNELAGLHRLVDHLQAEVARTRGAATAALTPASPVSPPSGVVASASAAPAASPPSDGSGARVPGWLEEWRSSRGFESDQAVIRVLGFQGFCLYQSIEKALESDQSVGTRTARRVLERLQERGLVEQEIPEGESRGRVPHFFWLTGKGRQAFQLLFGEEAVESEYHLLKARHKSHEHLVLNLQARDVFEARGYVVNLCPERSVIQGELYHDPDLVVIPPDQEKPLYVECERATASTTRGRDAKWENYARVTPDFCFVVPNTEVQTRIMAEVSDWVRRTKTPVSIRICNLSRLPPDRESPWTVERPPLKGW